MELIIGAGCLSAGTKIRFLVLAAYVVRYYK
jgi:hypothetical protein